MSTTQTPMRSLAAVAGFSAVTLMPGVATAVLCALVFFGGASYAAAPGDTPAGNGPNSPAVGASPAQQQAITALRNLNWVKGPTTVTINGNSKLVVPEGFVYLDSGNTDKFLELSQNIPNGREVMVAPTSLDWSAYLSFESAGYVKDDEKIDAPELLKSLQAANEEGNKERQQRGWRQLTLVDWASPPRYNAETKRLEWATILEADDRRSVNFFTKILGRHGYTSVVLAASPQQLTQAEGALNTVLSGYSFQSGETYAEYRPGDKVAEYGLAALVLGGAAAIATKKGFWAIAASFLAAGWKVIAAGAVAVSASLRSLFKKKA